MLRNGVTGMAEYIEKEAAKKELYSSFAFHNYAGGIAASVIDKIPAADVRENVKGEWKVFYEPGNYVCSVCGLMPEHISKFCPNCGAKMGGAEDGT